MDPPSDSPPPPLLLSQLQPPLPPLPFAPNLPGSAVNGADRAVKKRGRPPKAKVDTVQAAVPVFPHPVDINVPVAISPAKGHGKRTVAKRGRGRPPKVGVSRVATPGGVSRGRGRPKKNPRGRPPRPAVEIAAGALSVFGAPVGAKRRGRPPKASAVTKKPRKLSGKPVGRPKKAPDSHLLVAYLDLKAKLENLQSRVKQTVTFVRPYLNNNEAAMNALQELEFAATNANASSYNESQQQAQF